MAGIEASYRCESGDRLEMWEGDGVDREGVTIHFDEDFDDEMGGQRI